MSEEVNSHVDLLEMIEQLGAYVSSSAAFRPIVVESERGPRHMTLTLGLLLQSLASAEHPDAASLEAKLDAVRTEQAERWADKIRKEIRSAANLWCASIDDLERSDGGANWRNEAMRRTRAQRLIEDAKSYAIDVSAEVERLIACDQRAKRLVGPSPFILDAALEAAHPRDSYWWLYARPGAV